MENFHKLRENALKLNEEGEDIFENIMKGFIKNRGKEGKPSSNIEVEVIDETSMVQDDMQAYIYNAKFNNDFDAD